MKYYMIMCQRGHVGRNRSTEIKFAFQSRNLIEAMDRAKKMPSVKHARGIIHGYEITEAEYIEYRKRSAYERFPQHKAAR